MEEQGYVILRGVLEPHVVAGARREMEQLVEQEAQKLLAAGKIAQTLALLFQRLGLGRLRIDKTHKQTPVLKRLSKITCKASNRRGPPGQALVLTHISA